MLPVLITKSKYDRSLVNNHNYPVCIAKRPFRSCYHNSYITFVLLNLLFSGSCGLLFLAKGVYLTSKFLALIQKS
ncbi:hypothetical protein ACROYT_G041003 [Oculina patagonica]